MSAGEAAPGEFCGNPGRQIEQGNVDTVARESSAGKRPAAKWTRVLDALLSRPRLHRFDAERDPKIRDHTLPSTVSDIERKGVRIDRELVEIPGFGGGVAKVAEYSLPADQRDRARLLLEAARAARAGSP